MTLGINLFELHISMVLRGVKLNFSHDNAMIDFVVGRPLEVDYIFAKPVERARSLGVKVPKLETIVAQIQALERLR